MHFSHTENECNKHVYCRYIHGQGKLAAHTIIFLHVLYLWNGVPVIDRVNFTFVCEFKA